MASSCPTTPVFQAPTCPEWCSRPAGHYDPEDSSFHDHTFGSGVITYSADHGDHTQWDVDVQEISWSAGQCGPTPAIALAGLRQLVTDAEAAIAWIEALA